jgi:hypothetical protein
VASILAALARLGRPPAPVVSWHDLLAGTAHLLLDHLSPGDTARLESPGRDFTVERRLIAAGADVPDPSHPDADRISAADALRLPEERGRLRHARQWYLGFRAVLARLRDAASAVPDVRWMNHPDDVAVLFDKRECQARFAVAGVPVPRPLGSPRDFADLRERMRSAGLSRVFVKLASGSSGAGAVALAVSGPRLRAFTTVEAVREGGLRLYNTRRLRELESAAEVGPLVDALCREGVQAEEWVPKATAPGGGFDLRVLVIAGRVRHVVMRVGQGPMTNLHLLNRRGDLEALRERVPPVRWEAGMESCRRAAARFPGCHCVGVDLLFAPGFRRHVVLEANAFGGLLPGILCEGRDTYEDELALW